MAEFMAMAQVASTVLGTVGAIKQGRDAEAGANFQAEQIDQQAGQVRASAQRDALEQRRQAMLANSRLQALAGGGGLDPTVVGLSQDIAGEGEYRALTAMYEGEERAIGMETAASARRAEGKQAKAAANVKAFSTVLSNGPGLYEKGKTLYEKYGKGGAKDAFGTGDGLSQGDRRQRGVY